MTATVPELTPEQIESFGEELDAIRQRVVADLGERDAGYIRKVIRAQRGLEAAGRGLMFASFFPPAWLGGVTALSLSKILDNMEIGHNVMHGQYDWMNDPDLSGKGFEWDTSCPGDQWRHSHNYMHHTHTNIVGKDRDIGYGVLRMSEDQRWHPYYLGNPLYAALLATFFQYGVAFHDLELERVSAGKATLGEKRDMIRAIWDKTSRQLLKDYVLFPVLTGPSAPFTLAGNATANLTRNLWAFTIIFCGHFPDGTQEFTEEETEEETRGQWYYRQLLGSANLTGGKLFHPRGQPQLPDRAPPLSRHPGPPLRRDLGRGACGVRALRHPVQHRPAAQAVRQRRAQDREAGAAGPPGAARRWRSASDPEACARARAARCGSSLRSFPAMAPLDRIETRKDTLQVAIESGATHAGQIMGIVAGAVRDVTRELGDWATDVLEMRDAAKRAEADAPHETPDPGV